MKVDPVILQKRAVKAGVKASKRLHHVVTREELLAVRVQTMPSTLRGLLIVVGSVILLAGWFGWPLESGWARFFEGVGGLLMMMFGIFGVRRTLSKVVEKVGEKVGDTVDSTELVGAIIEGVAEVLGSVVDF
jgi:hypothetical protein